MSPSSDNFDKQPATGSALSTGGEQFRTMMENAYDAIVLTDNHGNVVEWNPSADRLFGIAKADAIGQALWDLQYRTLPDPMKTPQAQTQIKEVLKQFLQTGNISQDYQLSEVEIQQPNGSRRFIQTSAFPIKFANDVRLCSISRDITERKCAEFTLRNSQKMLQTVLDTIPAAVFWKDCDLHYLGANRLWLNAVGFKSSEEVIGKSDLELPWKEEQARSFREYDKRIIESGIAEYNIVESFILSDGSEGWARTNKVPLRDADGNIIGILGTYEDITERKRMEEELHKAQKLESLGMLAGGIAHDFNNLLSGIFGYLDLALASANDSTVSKYLSGALGGIDRARNLTGQLLTFAKGGAPIREIGNLSPVIRDAANLALSGSNISCAFDIPEGLWLCYFDKNQISQVIDNIVINAREAMPMGGSVLISARNISLEDKGSGAFHAGKYIKISLHDDGIGIPAYLMQKIFDPFFTTKHKGSGLGLSICHSIVKRHGGWIDAESPAGEGATFHLYLPASPDASMQVPPQKPSSIHKGSGRILIMDDEEIVRQSLGMILEKLGYSVEGRRDGRETLAFLKEEIKAGRSFAAIFLDLTIPGGMGGKDVALEIKKLNTTIPLFVTSGYSIDPVMANPTDYGFADSLCKPFTIDDLAEMLNRHLQ